MKKQLVKTLLIPFFLTLLLINPFDSEAQRRKKNNTPAASGFELTSKMLNVQGFRSLGPAAYSGRIADLAVNPDNHSEYYVGVASGGLWKTINHGTTFEPIFDKESVFSIGCLAMDPNNSNILWVGTGENNSQRNLAYGDGVYKTTDGGKTFTNMGLETSSQIGKIMIDPRNSNHVYVAAQGQAWGPGGDRGLYKTEDGGKSWNRILEVGDYTGASDMEMDPRNPDVLYVSFHQRERRVYSKINGGPESAIYKSEDAGKTWRKLTKGLPKGDVGRIGLALSPANPDIIYAVIELPDDKGGFYRSVDRGESWEKRSNKVSGSPQYYNEVYADPKDPDLVILMDTRNALSEDGGKTWQNIEGEDKHVDNHVIWINPDNTDHYLVGCDGGLYETYDRAKTWQFKSNLPITQYYHVRVDNDYPFYNVYGGAQDNGSWFGPSKTHRRNLVNGDWTYTIGGDGYLSIPDPGNPGISYHESQYSGIRRYDETTGNSVSIKPQPTEDEAFNFNWNTPYFISTFDNKTLYLGAQYVLKSTDMGGTWKKISPDMTRGIDQNTLPMMGKLWPPEAVAKNRSTSKFGNIFALAESPLKQGLLYVGTDDGLIWRSDDDGGNWTKYSSFPGVPDMTFVNYILPSMHTESTVYAAFDGRKNSSDFKPYLIKSTDKGKTWTSIAANLPSGTVYAIQEDHINPNILFIGTEWGVWVTIDGGKKWVQMKKGIPTIQVKDLTIQRRENDLVVATFGRGFYVYEDYSFLRELSKDVAAKEAHMFTIKDALMYFPSSNINYQGAVHWRSPNPDPAAKFDYYIKTGFESQKSKRIKAMKEREKSGAAFVYPTEEELRAESEEEKPELVLTIYDDNGQIMRKLTKSLKKGYDSETWDLRYLTSRGPRVAPGTYKVAIDKKYEGKLTRLVEPVEFKVKALPNALGTPDYATNFEFNKKVADLNGNISSARGKIRHMNERLESMSKILEGMAVESDALESDMIAAKKQIDEVAKAIIGGFGAKNSAISRLRFAQYAASSAEVDITGAMREQYELARQLYESKAAELNTLYETTIPGLENQFEELGGKLYNQPPARGWWFEEDK